MANIRLKKGQVDPKNPQATSVTGPQTIKGTNIDNVQIAGRKKQTPEELFAAIQNGEITLEEFTAAQNANAANAKALETFSKNFVNLKDFDAVTKTVDTVHTTSDSAALKKMSELFISSAAPAYASHAVSGHAQVGIALVINPNLSDADRLKVLDQLKTEAIVHAATTTNDGRILRTIYDGGINKSFHGELEQAIMSNSNVDPRLANHILSDAPGFAAEYYNAVGYNDIVDKAAKEFYKNPQLDRNPDRENVFSNDRKYPDYGTGSLVNRKNAVDRVLLRGSDFDTVKEVLNQEGLYAKRDLPVDVLINKNVPLSYTKEAADKINYASSVALWAIEQRDSKDVPVSLIETLKGSSDSFWSGEASEMVKTNGANPKFSDLKDPWISPYIGQYYSQEKVYKALEKKLASETDTESKIYRKARAIKLLADQYKDKLKVRAAFSLLD